MRRAILAFWSTQTVAGVLLLALAAGNIALFLTATPRPAARAAVNSFTEDFTTTTYRDAANTDATWLGDGYGFMGYGEASSTRYYFGNPPTGGNGFESISCADESTCYLITSVGVGTVILRTTDTGATWEMVYSGSLDSQHATSLSALHDVQAIPGSDTVYAAGEENGAGLVLKSTDGGTTWAEVNTGFSGTNVFQDIACSSAFSCVVANDNTSGTRIWYTFDGAANWIAATTPAGSYELRGLDLTTGDASSTWRAVGTAGTILVSAATTTPEDWTQETPFTGQELRDVEHISVGTIIVVGGTTSADSFIASSTDGGQNYATSTHSGTTWIWGIDCGNASACWTAGGAEDGSVRETMLTSDGANSWTVVDSNAPNNVSGGYLRDVAAIDGSTAYAAGGGTATWALVKTSTSTHFTDISRNTLCVYDASGCTSDTQSISTRGMWMDPTDGQTIYTAGWGLSKAVGKSTDGGETWDFPASDPGDGTPIDCADTQTCFVAGLGGFLAKTADGGGSWTTQTQAAVFDANGADVGAITTQMAWVVGTGGSASKPRIVRTVDGGTTYAAATGTISSSFVAHSVYAISTTTAWVGGGLTGNAVIYYTEDGGASWTEQFSGTGTGVIDIHCLPNNEECWGIWNDSTGGDNIVKTTDGVNWTGIQDVIDSAATIYSGIWFLDSDVGYVAADNCTGFPNKFFVTEDGGSTWSRVNFPCMDGEIAFYRNRGAVGGSSSAGLLGQIGRIVHAFTTSTLQSATVDSVSDQITCAGITPTQTLNGGTVTYEMSNDGGSTWASSGGSCAGISDTYEFAFAGLASDLRWRATMTGLESSPPTTTPEVDTVAINYVSVAPPATPTNTSPADGVTNVLLTPTLTASAFSDPDVGDTHASSRWEVSTVAGNFTSPVYSTTSTINLTSITVPSGTLSQNTAYYWHVKYVDNNGSNSAYSTATSFTTVGSGTVPPSTDPPTSPVARPDDTRRGTTTTTWFFTDTASNESGFSIVRTTDGSHVYATTNPIFTQNISELTEQEMTPATQHCDRAVVAFNDKGNSAITAAATYPCTWTLPAPPAALGVATTSPTTVTLVGLAADGNPADATYEICETTTGRCLAAGADGYILADAGLRQTRSAWGAEIVVVGLAPVTTHVFRAIATNGAGDAAAGPATEAVTTRAAVMFTVAKAVAINPAHAALAGIGFAADFSVAALGLMALAGAAWFLTLHRRSGSVRCAAGLCRIFRHHERSYAATVADPTDGPPLTRHARVHGFIRTTALATLAALALKAGVFAAALFLPTAVFGQLDFTGDGQAVHTGDTLVYQVSLHNLGPGDASDFVMEDPVPDNAAYVPGSLTVDGVTQTDACDADAACAAGGVVRVNRAVFPAAAGTVLTFSATVSGGAGGTVTNEACAWSAELTTPTCADPTANIIVAVVPTNQNQNRNQNVNAPPLAATNRPAPPPPSGTVNGNENQNVNAPPLAVNENANENVNAPAPPRESAITINGAPSSTLTPTSDATPEISGTGEPGTLVAISVDGAVIGVAFVGADGRWRFTPEQPLADGAHIVAVSLNGMVFDSAAFATDTVAPPAAQILDARVTRLGIITSILSAMTGQTAGDREATIQVSARTSADTRLVRIRVASDPMEVTFAPPAETWTRDVSGRFDIGGHTVTVLAYDAAGNASPPAQRNVTIPEPEALAAPLALLDDPQVEAASAMSAPILPVVAALNVAVAAGIPTLFNFLGLLLTQPALLFARKEKKGYGVVFNSLSKLPVDLAIVRLRDRDTSRILQTKVTDRLGRYVVFLKPGSYAVEVTKTGFVHPTQYLAGRADDVAYADVLSTHQLEAPAALRFAKNIPVDPVDDRRTPGAIRRAAALRRLQYAFAAIGPLLSLAALVITPTVTVLSLAALQIGMFALFRRLAYKKPPKSWGVVRDADTGKPVAGAVVRIFESTYNKLLETQVTDGRGRYAFIVGQSRYYVTAAGPGYATVTTSLVDFSSVAHGGLVTVDLPLPRPAGSPPSPTAA